MQPIPGLSTAAAGDEAQPSSSVALSKAAGVLVALLGVGLTLAPYTWLGGLLTTSGESVAGAVLETMVYGYLMLQVPRPDAVDNCTTVHTAKWLVFSL